MNHAVADMRVKLENQNRTIKVKAQVDMLKTILELGAPIENVLRVMDIMLMENLCQR
jgi:hypothetical protein